MVEHHPHCKHVLRLVKCLDVIFTEFLFLDDYLEYVVYARMWLSWFGGFVMLIIPALFCVLTITRGGKNARH